MRAAILTLAVVLAGCATASDVIPLSDGKYTITAGSHSLGSNGLGGTRSKALKEATEFCTDQGKQVGIERFDDQTSINTYSSSLTFRCN